jgi:ATP-dependent Clp protease adapter protein ClpS
LLLIDHYFLLLLYHRYQPDHHVLEISDLNNHKELLKQDLIHLLTKKILYLKKLENKDCLHQDDLKRIEFLLKVLQQFFDLNYFLTNIIMKYIHLHRKTEKANFSVRRFCLSLA